MSLEENIPNPIFQKGELAKPPLLAQLFRVQFEIVE